MPLKGFSLMGVGGGLMSRNTGAGDQGLLAGGRLKDTDHAQLSLPWLLTRSVSSMPSSLLFEAKSTYHKLAILK